LFTSRIIKRLFGAVAATALAVGLTAGAAAPAEATKTVWDKVAQCESGGRWHINTGNGFFGGLQFSSSTWRAHGGKKYASKANKASRAEQIAIARRVLASQGAGAWPTCGRRAGLTKANGHASKSATASTNPGAAKSKSSSKSKSTKKVSTAKPTKSTAKVVSKSVKVKRGDTLRKLAKRHHVDGGWKGLWKLNKKSLKNPNTIYVGQVLKIRK
jgi:resuscitation-promoting factor RpfA